MPFLQSVKNWGANPSVQTALCVSIVIIFIGIGTLYFNRDGQARAAEWLQRLRENSSIPNDNNIDHTKLSLGNQERLIEQLEELRKREDFHAEVMVFFYARYYMAIIMFPLLGALSAIMLFFISKRGWAAANDRLIAVFIVASAAAIYFGAIPAVFKLEDNIGDNKNLLLQYKGLDNELVSFLITLEDVTGKISNPNTFIHHVDDQMAKLNSLAVGFDYSKVPTTFIPEKVQTAAVTNTNTSGTKGKQMPSQ